MTADVTGLTFYDAPLLDAGATSSRSARGR